VRKRPVLLATLAIVAAGGAALWWKVAHPAPPPRPKPGWTPTVVILAGTGTDGRVDGPSSEASFSEPFGVAYAPDGSLVIADAGESNAIRRLTPDGRVVTIAGGTRGFADGLGSAARFDTPSHVAVDRDGVIYVADTGNHVIRRVTPDGSVTTLAGTGEPGAADGPAHAARFNGPVGIAVDSRGRVIVADTYNDRIRMIDRDGRVTTLAGADRPALADGTGADALFDTPAAVAVARDGTIVVADTGNDVLRTIDAQGRVTTLGAIDYTSGDEGLTRPMGVAAGGDGRLYVTDRRARVVELMPGGLMHVLAGTRPGFAGGPGPSARFRNPIGVAVAGDGALAVADADNRLLRRLDLAERLDAWAPASPRMRPGFDLARFAWTSVLWPLDPQEGPHEIAGTVGEPRGNSGGEGRERFHAGVDVRGENGDAVLAVRDGTVGAVIATAGYGTLSEYLTIGSVTYVHVRAGRDRHDVPVAPWVVTTMDDAALPMRVRVRRGTHVHAGEQVGTVNRFRHVHLNVGPIGEEGNALVVGMPGVVDTVAPTIERKGIVLIDAAGVPLASDKRGTVTITGPVQIVVDAWDRMDDSGPRRRLGVYRLGYQVLQVDGTPVPGFEQPQMTIHFDRLPSSPDAPPILYAEGSGIPFYGARRTRFRYVVTSTMTDDGVAPAPWDPSLLTDGEYLVRVIVEDVAGNRAKLNRDVRVLVKHPVGLQPE
jgi:sugar lactone lactonase YvrE